MCFPRVPYAIYVGIDSLALLLPVLAFNSVQWKIPTALCGELPTSTFALSADRKVIVRCTSLLCISLSRSKFAHLFGASIVVSIESVRHIF